MRTIELHPNDNALLADLIARGLGFAPTSREAHLGDLIFDLLNFAKAGGLHVRIEAHEPSRAAAGDTTREYGAHLGR